MAVVERANVCWVTANVILVSVAKIAAKAFVLFSVVNVVSEYLFRISFKKQNK